VAAAGSGGGAGRVQLAQGVLGPQGESGGVEGVVGDAQLVAGADPLAVATQPCPVQQPGACLLERVEPAGVGVERLLEGMRGGIDGGGGQEDVPSSVELRWRPGEHQAALTV
jgi:hypothetical protein